MRNTGQASPRPVSRETAVLLIDARGSRNAKQAADLRNGAKRVEPDRPPASRRITGVSVVGGADPTKNRDIYQRATIRGLEKPYMPSVAWAYPAPPPSQRQAVPTTPVIPTVAARNYRYGLTGDDLPWKPVAVYDDGRRVYVEFPRGIVQGEMPPIFVLGRDGEAQIANGRIHQNVLIVDRLFGAAELRLGGGDLGRPILDAQNRGQTVATSAAPLPSQPEAGTPPI